MNKYTPTDTKALIDSLRTVGMSCTKVSRDMGMSDNWLSSTISQTGGVPQSVVNYLDKVYGIKPERYAPQSQKEADMKSIIDQFEFAVTKALQENNPIDYERLYKVIYNATKEAMSEALKGEEDDG